MKQIILCVGVPCSGKSTWTNKILKDGFNKENYYLISRDKIRQYLIGDKGNIEYWENYASQIEETIIPIELFQLENLLTKSVNIIVDDTHSKIVDLERIIELAYFYDYKVKIKIFEIDLLTSKERIKKRDGDRFLHFMFGYHKRIKVVIDYINENYKDKLI